MSNKTIKAKEILADMKAGFDDDALMQKYQVSYSQLQSLFQKMVEAGVLLQMEVDQRIQSVEQKKEGGQEQSQVNEAQNLPVPSLKLLKQINRNRSSLKIKIKSFQGKTQQSAL